MKDEYFKSSLYLVFIFAAIVFSSFAIGDIQSRTFKDAAEFIAFGMLLILLVYINARHSYFQIKDGRWLISSGYKTFRKEKIDIYKIKYIYRYPELILKRYGSRMAIFFTDTDGILKESAQREVNFSNEVLVNLLRRIKRINPAIELDNEY